MPASGRKTDLEKPRPSILTTIQVLASRLSGCSKWRTYSYLGLSSQQESARNGAHAAPKLPLSTSRARMLVYSLGISHCVPLLACDGFQSHESSSILLQGKSEDEGRLPRACPRAVAHGVGFEASRSPGSATLTAQKTVFQVCACHASTTASLGSRKRRGRRGRS